MKNRITFPACFNLVLLAMFLISSTNTNAQEKKETGKIFTIVENMPTYKGCENRDSEKAKQDCTTGKIMEYLTDNLQYPEEAKAQGIEGKVFVSYVVDEKGNVKDVQVLRGVPNGELLNEEAARVVAELPNFNPGTQRGEAVAVRYNLPVNFKMSKDTNNESDR